MTSRKVPLLAGVLFCAPCLTALHAFAAGPDTAPVVAKPFQVAQAPLTEEQKKRIEEERRKAHAAPPAAHPAQPHNAPPPPKGNVGNAVPKPNTGNAAPQHTRISPDSVPHPKTTPIVPPKTAVPTSPNVPARVEHAPVTATPHTPPTPPPKIVTPAVPPVVKPVAPAVVIAPPTSVAPHSVQGGAPNAAHPAAGASVPLVSPPVTKATATQPPVAPPAVKAASVPPAKFDQLKQQRQQRVEDGGRRTVIQEPGSRVIVKQDNRLIIQHDESARFARIGNAQTQRRGDGVTETFYVRPDGFRVITEVDANGRLLRRYRRGPDGREFDIVDNRRFWRNAGLGIGAGAIALAIALNLPPPRVTIPRDRYIVDYERASDDDLYETLFAPPVERLERGYSLEEIRYNHELREHMRRIDLDAITFDFGSYQVLPEQYPRLERLARVIKRLLDRNPDELFLVEGHTDAVGGDVDNLSLSDRRAEAVAQVLTDEFNVPPENLTTQGYGEQYLKVNTQAPERANRRVAIRRITPLMAGR